MNSTPAVSNARRTARSLAAVIDVSLSAEAVEIRVDNLASTKLHKQGVETLLKYPLIEANLDKPVKRYEPVIERDEHDAIRAAYPDLARLLRYERRASSRQKRALYTFIAIKLTTPIRGTGLASDS